MSFLYLSNSLFDNNYEIFAAGSTIYSYTINNSQISINNKNHVITEIENVPRHYLA